MRLPVNEMSLHYIILVPNTKIFKANTNKNIIYISLKGNKKDLFKKFWLYATICSKYCNISQPVGHLTVDMALTMSNVARQ